MLENHELTDLQDDTESIISREKRSVDETESNMSNGEEDSNRSIECCGTSHLQPAWPEDHEEQCFIGLLSSLTYSYMNPILRKGAKQKLAGGHHLLQEDLFSVPSYMQAKQLNASFIKFYEEENGNLFLVLWRLIKPLFIPAMFYQLLAVIAQIALPLFVRELLRVIEAYPGENIIREGLVYAILLPLSLLVNAFSNMRQKHLATRSGVVIRTAIVAVMYDRILNISPESCAALTSGELTNMVATDTQKILEVVQDGNFIWSLPLAIVIVTILLLTILGPTTIFGVLVLLLLIPTVRYIVAQMVSVREARAEFTDQRVEIISAMLQGMKVTKLNNYEHRYQKKIESIRDKEIKLLHKELGLWALTLVCTVSTPVLATAATFVTYIFFDSDGILTASTVFSVMILFQTLRFPINLGSKLIGRIGPAYQATKRLSRFFALKLRETKDYHPLNDSTDMDENVIEIKNGSFSISNDFHSIGNESSPDSLQHHTFTLSNVNVTLAPKQILAVLGPVGSGKSTFVKSLIGDIQPSPGTSFSIRGKVSFASQTPFVLNSTLRENILFGLPFDEARYQAVIEACCLNTDLQQLPAGDMTEIGERGVTLSGGQKQRVNLARVAYSNPQIAVFDDPLSALDSSTSRQIFERLLKGSGNQLLSSCAIVLVTHASYFLHRVDKIMVIVEGKSVFLGSWDEILSFEANNPSTQAAIEYITNAAQEDKADTNESSVFDKRKTKVSFNYSVANLNVGNEIDQLMTIEERKHGFSSLKTWFTWFKYAGGCLFVTFQIFFMTVDRLFYVANEWWLSFWSSAAYQPVSVLGSTFPAQTEGREAQILYLKVYGTIILVSLFATVARSEWAVHGGVKSATRLFSLMLTRVLHAPMSFFETTPLGRLLNRFTYDIEVLDVTLTESVSITMISCSWFVAGICVMITILPWIACAIIPISIMYNFVFRYYRNSGVDLQRLDAVSRSPVQVKFAEVLDGATVIRVFHKERIFISKFQEAVNTNSSAILNFMSVQSWIGLRVELFGSLIVLCSSLMVVIHNETLQITPGLFGLLIIWSSNFTITLNYMCQAFAESEAAVTSIERIISMSTIQQEKSMITNPSVNLDLSWPRSGTLEFKEVCSRYRSTLPLSLNKLSFKIESGKRCGVVGRTGAGKSTLTAVLFRLIEIESGVITLDGVDLATIGLKDVRGRMTIIPQDPFLASGSIRECVDPFGSYQDEDILEALIAVRLTGVEKRSFSILNDFVQEGGLNYSVGERQLICLARAILAKPKILIMDEATASVDSRTDALIQIMLRERFQNTTLLTIAHRLDTIMDYDSVLVMDKGKVIEYDEPITLLEKNEGIFYEMVLATGEESARSLKCIASKARAERERR